MYIRADKGKGMYYSEDIVEEVRTRNDIADIIGGYVNLSKRGSNYTGLCPFHNEKTPSFSVNSSKQMYHCFGCGAGGNVFTFVMQYENYNFTEALKMLAERAGVTLPEEKFSKEAKQASDIKAKILEINKIAAKYYYYQLKSNRGGQAYEYLKNRQLSDEIISKFGLGYADKYSDDLYQYLKNQGYDDQILKKSGLITIDEAKGGHDKFWNRVMFPIMDINNRVIAFGGRVMGDGMPKYLNSPETEIFDKGRNLYGMNIARQSRMPYMLLCEGYMDVISLHQAGFTNAVASLGTAFTPMQAKLLSRYTNEAVITYDSDNAGIGAVLKAVPILKAADISVRVLNLRPHKDPDDFIKNEGKEAYEKRIEQADNSFFFEADTAMQSYNIEDPEQKTRFHNDLARLLLQFSEEFERNNYIEAASGKYRIDYENLKKLVNKLGSKKNVSDAYKEALERDKEQWSIKKNKPTEGMKMSQKLLLTWLVDDYTAFKKIEGVITPDDFSEELYKQAARLVFEQYKNEQKVIPAKIINFFESKEEQTLAADLFTTKVNVGMSDAQSRKAFADTVTRVKKNSLEAEYEQAIEKDDIISLQYIIQKQKELEQLHSSLIDG